MLRPALALILTFAAVPAAADPCDSLAELAGRLMALRQDGAPRVALEHLASNSDTPRGAAELVSRAWEEEPAESREGREALSFHFSALVFEACRAGPHPVLLARN